MFFFLYFPCEQGVIIWESQGDYGSCHRKNEYERQKEGLVYLLEMPSMDCNLEQFLPLLSLLVWV